MKFKSDIEVQAGLKDSSGSIGTSGQVLSSTGSNVSWINQSTVANDVENEVKAGVAINKGQAVYVTGADGTNIIVGLASNASEATSSKTLGLLDATVAINGFANVVQIGRLSGLNTLGATAGDPVWLGTGGNLIYGLINKPYAPANLVFIGVVTRVNVNNGEIFVNVQNGFELNEIHDVDLKTTVPINGDILGYNGTLWVNKTIAGWLGYTPANASGTTNYVSKFTGTTTLGNSQIFDNGTNVGIGTSAPDAKLRVEGVVSINGEGNGVLVDSGTTANARVGLMKYGGYEGMLIAGSGTLLRLGHRTDSVAVYGGTPTIREDLVITSAGNVGIGTSSPVSIGTGITTLDIQGSAAGGIAFGLSGTKNYIYGASTMYVEAHTTAVFATSGSEKMRITSGGNVGIGTTAPNAKLEVSAGQSFINQDYLLGWNVAGSATLRAYIIGTSGNELQFWNRQGGTNTQAITLNASGNVGIGTTSPAYKLDVNGTVNIVGSFGNRGVDAAYRLKFYDNGGVANDAGIGLDGYAGGGEQMWFNSLDGFYWATGTNGEKMRITQAGNVGIGTSNPLAMLHVASGEIRNSFGSGQGGTNYFNIIDGISNGFRTVVTTSNQITYTFHNGANGSILNLAESGAATFSSSVTASQFKTPGFVEPASVKGLFNNTNYSGPGWNNASLVTGNGATGIMMGGDAASYTYGWIQGVQTDNGANKNLILEPLGGNVGIGTTTPVAISAYTTLDVRGTNGSLLYMGQAGVTAGLRLIGEGIDGYIDNLTPTGSLQFRTNNATERMRITSGGNVGIGTSSPTAKLDVNGNVATTGITSTGNKRLSLGILDINVNNETQIRINTTIPFASGAADFTVNIKGFAYGAEQMVSLSIGWHYYLSTFWNETAISNGAWSPTISLAQDANGFVVIYLPSPPYWSKLYVESVYSSNYQANYSSGWTWANADLSNCTDISVLTYQPLATSITGSSGSTSAISGTTNYVSKFTTSSTLGNSLIYDNGTNVGLGTTTPGAKLDVSSGNINLSNSFNLTARNNANTFNIALIGRSSTDRVIIDADGYGTNIGGGGTVLINPSGGNVGIGTTSPTNKLDVVGGLAHFQQNSSSGSAFRWGTLGTAVSPDTMLCMNQLYNGSGWTILNSSYGTTYLNLGSAVGSPDIAFGTGGANTPATEKMRITNGGNVGIGTSSPAYKLVVQKTDIATPAIMIGGGFYGGPRLQVYGLDDNATAWMGLGTDMSGGIYEHSIYFPNASGNGRLSIGNYNGTTYSEKMCVINSGNVGIGTTSPGHKLQVSGTAGTSWSTLLQSNSKSAVYSAHADGYGMAIETSQNTSAIYTFKVAGGDGTNIGTNEYFRITGTGNVGIGTSAPASKLHLQGTNTNITITDTTYNRTSNIGYIDNANLYLANDSSSNTYIGRYNNVFLAYGGGNVGIGTTSPGYKLEVNGGNLGSSAYSYVPTEMLFANNGNGEYFEMGSIRTSAGSDWTTAGFRIQERIDSTWMAYMQFNGDGNLGGMSFGTGTSATSRQSISERMRILSNGNVGIGTTSPSQKLDVSGNGIFRDRLTISADAGNEQFVIQRASNTNSQLILGYHSDGYGRIQAVQQGTGYTPLVLQKDGGNVGIGTTSPQGKLSVDGGNIRFNYGNDTNSYYLYLNHNSSYDGGMLWTRDNSTFDWQINNLGANGDLSFYSYGTGSPAFVLQRSSGNVGIGATNTFGWKTFINSGSSSSTLLLGSSTVGTYIALNDNNSTAAPRIGGITNDLVFTTSNIERMRITSAGNVGIGTTSPGYKLQVNDTIATVTGFGSFTALQSAAGTGFRWTLNNDGTFRVQKTADGFSTISATPIAIDSSNRVGIGTTAPQRDLQVGAFSGSPEICIGSSTSGNGTLAFGDGASGNDPWRGYVQYNHSVDAMIFGTVNGEKVRITSAGYMGIGTTSPSYPLYVSTQVSNVSIYADYDIVAFSDQSVKENIRPIENVLERVIESRGVLYDRIDSGEKNNIGFIAQELEVAFPELVVTNEDGTKAVKYQNAVAVLFEAVKEQQKQIDEIKRILNGITN